MRSQRIRVPSAKARANEGLDFDLFEDPAKGPLTSEQASITNNLFQATAIQPTKSRNAKGKGKKKNISTTPNTNEEASEAFSNEEISDSSNEEAFEGPKIPSKLYSILSRKKSARELRKDPAIALFPLVVKEYAS
jgi:hypothetical protein